MNIHRRSLYHATIRSMLARGIPPAHLRPAEQWERLCKNAGVPLPVLSAKEKKSQTPVQKHST